MQYDKSISEEGNAGNVRDEGHLKKRHNMEIADQCQQ
jgi:hypothetical protein